MRSFHHRQFRRIQRYERAPVTVKRTAPKYRNPLNIYSVFVIDTVYL